jgi:hypothetical protein
VSASLLSIAACTGGEVVVGTGTQKAQLQKDGSPTGDGKTCSWANTAAWDTAVSSSGATASTTPSTTFNVGDSFKSLDGCNDCSCGTSGIACTTKACSSPGNPGTGCSLEAKICPDGSTVGRSGPNCEFAACGTPVACSDEAKQCPDGSYVGRTGANCEFSPCPGADSITVDQSKLGADCSADPHTCPSGQSCYSFPSNGLHCVADGCAAVTCPSGKQCMELETFPAQVTCGN